jgi:hypothetical protein
LVPCGDSNPFVAVWLFTLPYRRGQLENFGALWNPVGRNPFDRHHWYQD